MQAQIVEIGTYQDNVFKAITSFLESIGVESDNTRITYESAIRDFFMKTRNKKIEYLNVHDLEFNYLEVETYRNSLLNQYKNATINTKMTAVKKMYDKLTKYGIEVNATAFDIRKLKEHDTESYGTMTVEEVNKAIEVVSSTRNGYEKALLIELAFATALRKTVLLELEWDSIYIQNDMYIVKTLGKGNKWSFKRIEKELYDKLMDYKAEVKRKKVFALSSSAVQRMMNLITSKIDFGNRNITFHSFKKASIEEIGLLTNYDLKAMQRHGDHSDISTTLNVYVAQKEIEDMVTVSKDVKELDFSVLEHLTKEELIDIIKSSDRVTQVKLLDIANRS